MLPSGVEEGAVDVDWCVSSGADEGGWSMSSNVADCGWLGGSVDERGLLVSGGRGADGGWLRMASGRQVESLPLNLTSARCTQWESGGSRNWMAMSDSTVCTGTHTLTRDTQEVRVMFLVIIS